MLYILVDKCIKDQFRSFPEIDSPLKHFLFEEN